MTIRSYLMATFYDSAMKATETRLLHPYREKLLANVEGSVLEIGSGTGINLQFYQDIDKLICSEPDGFMRKQLRKRIKTHSGLYPIELLESSGESIDLPDNTVDNVVSTLVLCSVLDQEKVLSEIQRVLKPGGKFLFIEHVCSPQKKILKWQKRFTPAWSYMFDNCHLDRCTHHTIQSKMQNAEIEELRLGKLTPVFESWVSGYAINAK